MVQTVGSISIDLSTNSQKFAAGFKNAATTVDQQSRRMSASVGGIQKSFSKLSGMIGSFGAGLAGGAAFAGLTSLTGLISTAREAIGRLDDIADRAKTSGIGTDLLQSLEHGAQQAGLEVTDLAGGLSFFAKGMGQAAEGTGRLYSGLLKLNPELLRNILNARDQEERLRLVAEALDKTEDASKRAALSAALFGDVDMARLFEGGAAGIDKMVAAAKELGIHSAAEIARAHEYDEALTDINKSINATVDSLVINLGDALVGTSRLFQAGIEGAGNYIRQIKELALTLQAFEQDPSGKNLADFLLGPKGGGSVAGFFRDMIAGIDETEKHFGELQVEISDTEIKLAELYERKREGFPVDDDIARTVAHLDFLQAKVRETSAVFEENAKRMALAEQFRAAENASMAGVSSGRLPTVHYPSGQGSTFADPDALDRVEDAIDKGTEATNRVASRAADVYRGIGQANGYIQGGFADSVKSTDGTTSAVTGLGGSLGGGGGGAGSPATGVPGSPGASFFAGNVPLNSWFFETDGSEKSMKGLTFSGGKPNPNALGYDPETGTSQLHASLLDYRAPEEDLSTSSSDTSDFASSISDSSSGDISVNVVVKPILEGTRLSGQSTAEIKQAASAGANAALRAYYGR